jgi:hypothetical protein
MLVVTLTALALIDFSLGDFKQEVYDKLSENGIKEADLGIGAATQSARG